MLDRLTNVCFNKSRSKVSVASVNKRPMDLNGHLSIRDSTLTSCQKGSYLQINSPIKFKIIINNDRVKLQCNLLKQSESIGISKLFFCVCLNHPPKWKGSFQKS